MTGFLILKYSIQFCDWLFDTQPNDEMHTHWTKKKVANAKRKKKPNYFRPSHKTIIHLPHQMCCVWEESALNLARVQCPLVSLCVPNFLLLASYRHWFVCDCLFACIRLVNTSCFVTSSSLLLFTIFAKNIMLRPEIQPKKKSSSSSEDRSFKQQILAKHRCSRIQMLVKCISLSKFVVPLFTIYNSICLKNTRSRDQNLEMRMNSKKLSEMLLTVNLHIFRSRKVSLSLFLSLL